MSGGTPRMRPALAAASSSARPCSPPPSSSRTAAEVSAATPAAASFVATARRPCFFVPKACSATARAKASSSIRPTACEPQELLGDVLGGEPRLYQAPLELTAAPLPHREEAERPLVDVLGLAGAAGPRPARHADQSFAAAATFGAGSSSMTRSGSIWIG